MSEGGKKEALSFDTSSWVFDTDKADTRFLGLHTLDDIKFLIVKSGLDGHLRKKGLHPYDVRIGVDDEGLWLLLITMPGEEGLPLVDFRVSRVRKCGIFSNTPFDFLKIEWLSTYDPTMTGFSLNRPRLPGQKVPGLGCLRHLLRMMHYSSQTLRMDGFLDIPEHLHLAIMYAKSFCFLDPEFEKTIRTLLSDLKRETLFRISWASIAGAIYDRSSGQPWIYTPSEQAFAISKNLKTYFASKMYTAKMKSLHVSSYYINEDVYNMKLASVMSEG